jgi:CRISPR type IV-associated protein Csf3
VRRTDWERKCDRLDAIPLRVEAVLASPLAGRGYVHLDALLAFAAMHDCHYPGASRAHAVTSADALHDPPPLPFASHGATWASSCLWPVSDDRASTAWGMRPAVEYAHLAQPNAIRLDAGATRMRRERIALWPARRLVAYCLGDPDLIESMLARHAGSVGHKRSQGYGRVERWEIHDDAAAHDRWRVTADGRRASRELPHEMGERMGVRPPYWYRPWWLPAIAAGAPLP